MANRLFKLAAISLAHLAICAAVAFAQDVQPTPAEVIPDPAAGTPSPTLGEELSAQNAVPPVTPESLDADDIAEPAGPIYEIGVPDESSSWDRPKYLPLDAPAAAVEYDRVHLGGSLQAGGIMLNGHHPNSHFNGPVTFSDRDNGQLNQYYMVGGFGMAAGDDGWYGGLRYDLYFGSDYVFTTAAGLDGRERGNRARWNTTDSFRYGWSMPQLYTQIGHDDLDLKIGHFYSPIGYESAPAKSNFFITRSYAFQYGEPITQTGAIVKNSIDDCWSWTAGVVGGWDTFDANTRPALISGLMYNNEETGSVALTLVSGDDSTENLPGIGPFANRTMYSLVWMAHVSSRMEYVFQHDLGIQQDAVTLTGRNQAEWYGLNQYLFYRLHNCWTAGARFEWFRDDDGFCVTGLRPGNPLVGDFFAGNFYETAIGLNFNPCGGFILRPEVRYDWFNPSNSNVGSQNPFDDNTRKSQILYGIDMVLHY